MYYDKYNTSLTDIVFFISTSIQRRHKEVIKRSLAQLFIDFTVISIRSKCIIYNVI